MKRDHRPIRIALLRFAGTALVQLLAALPLLAEPAIDARLDLKTKGSSLTGDLQFDLGGGEVRGHADLAVPADPSSPPLKKQGGATPGKFQVRIDLEGAYDGGSFGVLRGTAHLSGTFTDDKGCQAKVQGKGTCKGRVSGPRGAAEVDCDWDRVEFDGCELASPQPFSASLHFTFEPTQVIPPVKRRHETEPSSALGAAATPSYAAWWVGGILGGLALVSVTGIVVAKRRRRKRQPRRPPA